MKADLHIHSDVSDGSATIAQIIEAAKAKGLDAIAVTDHDTLSHRAQIPSDAGIQVLAGVELSTVHRKSNTQAHILGYNIKRPRRITALTEPLLEARNKNSERQAEILIGLGFRIETDKLARADGKYLYKQHIMDWLVATGQVPELFGDFYQTTFKRNGPCAFDIAYTDVFEALRAVKEAGGLAVLAHPGRQKNFWLIPKLVESGLDGLELNHHANGPQDREIIRDYADRFGLFLTGGSDYHGRYEPQPFGIGDFLSEDSGAQAICPAPVSILARSKLKREAQFK
ncbi:MAG: PHP domain-containing protein [Clostridiales Family XIII bacterium]|jgi:predicted metal-dependent phosphoesterase TrpH|nr:PHP domain-containing protein [Clostridiales Family XIII bacterium]